MSDGGGALTQSQQQEGAEIYNKLTCFSLLTKTEYMTLLLNAD